MQIAREQFGDDPDIIHHPAIRSREACIASSSLAVKMARETGARLHIAHISTAEELELLETFDSQENPIEARITGEACVSHLIYTQEDYKRLGTRIKCNPAIKHNTDREALRRALTDGRIAVVGTDHASHLLADKNGGARSAASGIPMIQFSLISMLELVDDGILTLTRLVELMCHNPAKLFEVRNRGFLREGYQADIVLVRPNTAWIASKENILSRCGWSPMEGHMYLWRVERTLCNGHTVFLQGKVDTSYNGQPVAFR